MPVDRCLTPRQLRTIADRVESLTKARINNQAMGVPTTPDRFECRFPSGHRGTVVWAEAPLTSTRARERNDGQPVSRYVVELHLPTEAVEVHLPAETAEPDTPGTTAVQEAIKAAAAREGIQRMRLGL